VWENDKRVFRVNKEVCDLFNIGMDVNQSTDYRDQYGFNFWNLEQYVLQVLEQNNT